MGVLELPEVSGTGSEMLQNSQKLRVLWHGRTVLTRSGYGYECRTEHAEVRCVGMDGVYNSQKFRAPVIPG